MCNTLYFLQIHVHKYFNKLINTSIATIHFLEYAILFVLSVRDRKYGPLLF